MYLVGDGRGRVDIVSRVGDEHVPLSYSFLLNSLLAKRWRFPCRQKNDYDWLSEKEVASARGFDMFEC